MTIQENVSLRPYNTFGFDVKARYFVAIRTASELQQVLRDPRWTATPKWVMGGGSNVLFTRDVDALVLRIEIEGNRKGAGRRPAAMGALRGRVKIGIISCCTAWKMAMVASRTCR